MKLWEISKLLNPDALFTVDENTAVDKATGEVFHKDVLDNLPMEQVDKSKNIGLVIKCYDADVDQIDKEIKRLTAMKRTYTSRINSLKSYLLTFGCPVNDTAVQIKFSKGRESVAVEDEEAIPEQFRKWSWVPNKAELTKALKNGEEIPGAKLVRKPSVTVK